MKRCVDTLDTATRKCNEEKIHLTGELDWYNVKYRIHYALELTIKAKQVNYLMGLYNWKGVQTSAHATTFFFFQFLKYKVAVH